MGLVGESGSGKTTPAHALFGFARAGRRSRAARSASRPRAVRVASADLRALRGRYVTYVPQAPGPRSIPRSRARTDRRISASTDASAPRTPVGEVLGLVGWPKTAHSSAASRTNSPAVSSSAWLAVALPAPDDRARRADHRSGRHHPGSGPRRVRRLQRTSRWRSSTSRTTSPRSQVAAQWRSCTPARSSSRRRQQS